VLTLRTPAKVNIGLWVERRRSDGYHELRSLFFVPSDSKNLVWLAADLYFTYTGVRSGIRVDLKKEIPVGHGLGGGSSDAAATLIGLDRLFNTRLSRDELRSLALELGMDCSFFLDPRPCLVTGRGERIKPLKVPSFDLVIYSPGFGVSTTWAYKQLKRLTNGSKPCRLRSLAMAL
jgi:4-diphosphocytidyl-2-C-methyl-D-erythritol kinase